VLYRPFSSAQPRFYPAILGFPAPAIGAILHHVSSTLVVLNSARLLRSRV